MRGLAVLSTAGATHQIYLATESRPQANRSGGGCPCRWWVSGPGPRSTSLPWAASPYAAN